MWNTSKVKEDFAQFVLAVVCTRALMTTKSPQ